MEILIEIIKAVAPGIIVGIVMYYWNRKQNERSAELDEQEQFMKRKDAVVIALLVATAELSYAVTMAIKRGSPNGEVEIAVDRYNRAMRKFRDLERERLYVDY